MNCGQGAIQRKNFSFKRIYWKMREAVRSSSFQETLEKNNKINPKGTRKNRIEKDKN